MITKTAADACRLRDGGLVWVVQPGVVPEGATIVLTYYRGSISYRNTAINSQEVVKLLKAAVWLPQFGRFHLTFRIFVTNDTVEVTDTKVDLSAL